MVYKFYKSRVYILIGLNIFRIYMYALCISFFLFSCLFSFSPSLLMILCIYSDLSDSKGAYFISI